MHAYYFFPSDIKLIIFKIKICLKKIDNYHFICWRLSFNQRSNYL